MSLITRNAKEYRSVTAQLMSQNLPIVSLACVAGVVLPSPLPPLFAPATQAIAVPSGRFVFYVILTISYLRAQTVETSSLLTDSWGPPVQASRDFFYIDCMTVCFNCACNYFP